MEKLKTPTGEDLLTGYLPNGLHYGILPKRGFVKKYAVLATKYGSWTQNSKFPERALWKCPMASLISLNTSF